MTAVQKVTIFARLEGDAWPSMDKWLQGKGIKGKMYLGSEPVIDA
jgi:hypothetical protein